jgi:hypothetical protein
MQTTDDLESSIIFLGLAEEVHGDPNSFPIHPVNIIQISQFKPHVIFPIPSEGYKCIFLIRNGFINRINEESIEIVIYDPDNRIFGKIQMEFGLRVGCPKLPLRGQFSCPELGPRLSPTAQYFGQLIGFSAYVL